MPPTSPARPWLPKEETKKETPWNVDAPCFNWSPDSLAGTMVNLQLPYIEPVSAQQEKSSVCVESSTSEKDKAKPSEDDSDSVSSSCSTDSTGSLSQTAKLKTPTLNPKPSPFASFLFIQSESGDRTISDSVYSLFPAPIDAIETNAQNSRLDFFQNLTNDAEDITAKMNEMCLVPRANA